MQVLFQRAPDCDLGKVLCEPPGAFASLLSDVLWRWKPSCLSPVPMSQVQIPSQDSLKWKSVPFKAHTQDQSQIMSFPSIPLSPAPGTHSTVKVLPKFKVPTTSIGHISFQMTAGADLVRYRGLLWCVWQKLQPWKVSKEKENEKTSLALLLFYWKHVSPKVGVLSIEWISCCSNCGFNFNIIYIFIDNVTNQWSPVALAQESMVSSNAGKSGIGRELSCWTYTYWKIWELWDAF
jgi:hypothetical protein